MITPFQIYLWGIADQLHEALLAAIIITAIMTVLFGIFCAFFSEPGTDNDVAKSKKWLSRCITMFTTSVFLLMAKSILPSSKTIACILVIPAITNSQPIQKDLPDLYNMAVDALKSELKTAKP